MLNHLISQDIEFMIIQLTEVTTHTIRDLNMKVGQKQSKIERVVTAWNVLLK